MEDELIEAYLANSYQEIYHSKQHRKDIQKWASFFCSCGVLSGCPVSNSGR